MSRSLIFWKFSVLALAFGLALVLAGCAQATPEPSQEPAIPQTGPEPSEAAVPTEEPLLDTGSDGDSSSGFRFDAWRETPPVQYGAAFPLTDMEDRGPEPLSEGDMVATGPEGEALLVGQMDQATCSVFLFFDSALTKSACPKASSAGNTSCQTGSAVYRDCDSLLIQTPSGEAFQVGSWTSVTYLKDLKMTVFVSVEGDLQVWPVLDEGGRSLGEPISVPPGAFLYTAPDRLQDEVAGLPPREPIPINFLPELVAELPEMLPWMERTGARAEESRVPFPEMSQEADLVGSLSVTRRAQVGSVENNRIPAMLVPVQIEIENQGGLAAGPFQAAVVGLDGNPLQVSSTGLRDFADRLDISGLESDEVADISAIVRIPPPIETTQVQLFLLVDYCAQGEISGDGCRVAESREDNNRSAAVSVEVPEEIMAAANNPFDGAKIINTGWIERSNYLVTIQLQQDVPGDYTARVGSLDFRCQVLERYPSRLYCTGPVLQPGSRETIEVFAARDGTWVFSGDFTVSAMPATDTPTPKPTRTPTPTYYYPYPYPGTISPTPSTPIP